MLHVRYFNLGVSTHSGVEVESSLNGLMHKLVDAKIRYTSLFIRLCTTYLLEGKITSLVE